MWTLLILALSFAPAQSIPGWQETDSQRLSRYADIVFDIQETISKRGSLPGMTPQDSAIFVLAVAVGESGLAPDADWGPCYRLGKWRSRCDGGNSVGIAQTWVKERFRRWYFDNRRAHLALAHRRMGASLWACRKLPFKHRLAMYGSGNCTSKAGRRGSARRMALFSSMIQKRWQIERSRRSETRELHPQLDHNQGTRD